MLGLRFPEPGKTPQPRKKTVETCVLSALGPAPSQSSSRPYVWHKTRSSEETGAGYKSAPQGEKAEWV
eukprot:1929322-Amphidinium_carterae.1